MRAMQLQMALWQRMTRGWRWRRRKQFDEPKKKKRAQIRRYTRKTRRPHHCGTAIRTDCGECFYLSRSRALSGSVYVSAPHTDAARQNEITVKTKSKNERISVWMCVCELFATKNVKMKQASQSLVVCRLPWQRTLVSVCVRTLAFTTKTRHRHSDRDFTRNICAQADRPTKPYTQIYIHTFTCTHRTTVSFSLSLSLSCLTVGNYRHRRTKHWAMKLRIFELLLALSLSLSSIHTLSQSRRCRPQYWHLAASQHKIQLDF